MLGRLSEHGVDRLTGLSSLRTEDQARVRLALEKRRVDPANDTQPSKPPKQTSAQMSPSNEKKRKVVTVSDVLPSQNIAAPSPTQAAVRRAVVIGDATWEEGADPNEVVEEQVDELYCTLSSNVVGVQYYKGGVFLST